AGIKKGKYQIVVKAASEIWQKFGNNKASLEILLSQMRLYKLYKPPYNEMYVFSSDTPKIWWNSVDTTHDCLQKLAILIHDITPNSAACERTFSTLSWIYGKRHLHLSVSKIESMAKIRSYYLSTINKELKYPGENISALELKSLNQVPNHQVFVVIENFFELNEVPFVLDPDDIDDNDGSSLENNMNDEVGESNEDCTNDYDLDDV
ncbi:4314_t:CDS:2, partial [Entrophospora sp. SA101]